MLKLLKGVQGVWALRASRFRFPIRAGRSLKALRVFKAF